MPLSKVISCIKNLPSEIKKANKDANKLSLDRLLGDYKERIFVEGLATDGQLITSKVIARQPRVGAYSEEWGSYRDGVGRQTSVVDMNVTGENLRDRIVIGISGNDDVIGFDNSKARLIAEATESYRRVDVFKISSQEKQDAVDSKKAEVVFRLKKYIKDCLK